MKRHLRSCAAHIAVAVTIMGSAAGCGGSAASLSPQSVSSSADTTPAQAHLQSLDTAQVLEQALQVSETADPYEVDSGELRLTDTSDSTDPLGFVAR
jgi:hypothetical protein